MLCILINIRRMRIICLPERPSQYLEPQKTFLPPFLFILLFHGQDLFCFVLDRDL